MWISRQFFDMVLSDNKRQQFDMQKLQAECAVGEARVAALREQKAKDDITIDWMRHRVNALEKEKAALLVSKGINISVPEIVPTRPGTVSSTPPGFDHLPSFEDVGDEQASKFGVAHDDLGHLILTMPDASHGGTTN
jgi:hypothetical protein